MKTPNRNKAAKAVRKAKVAVRLANGRTPAEQLAELDKRLGAGVGAKKERARLAKAIAGTAKLTKVQAQEVMGALKADIANVPQPFKPLKAKNVKKATK